MRNFDSASLAALSGSRPADTLIVWVWRDGSLVLPEPLDIISWSHADEAGDSVKIGQKWSFTVADPDGRLGAWLFDDPLGVGGTRLQVVERTGGAGANNIGWYRLTGNEPSEVHESRVIAEYGHDKPDSDLAPHTRQVFTTRAVVKLEAVDLTFDVDRDRLEAPESPAEAATVLTEVARLLEGHFPVVVEPGVEDVAISRQLVFDRERLEAVQDLLGRVNARYRMGGDGELRVYPRVTEPVLRLEPGMCLVDVSRKQSVDGLYNRWVVEGKDGEGFPVVAVVSIDTGPLRYGGPHGKAPFFYSSEMITSYGQALAYGIELRDQFLGSLAVELRVETAPRPELQAGDWIEVGYPVPAGHVAYLPGMVSSISRGGSNVPGTNTLTVACAYRDVVTALGRTEWAQYLTAGTPPLTWDRMPTSWGNLPPLTWDELPA